MAELAARMGPFRASLERIYATFLKEFIQLRRDRITFATMIFIPLVQLMLFGYAINTDPKHLPTAVLIQDDSAFSRSFLSAMQASDYFDLRTQVHSEAELDRLILSGAVQFGVQIPADFGRSVIRGEKPGLLVIADATDPSATGGAVAAVVENAHLATYTVTGADLAGLAERLRQTPGVDMVAPFGTALHVSGRDAGALEAAIAPLRQSGAQQWRRDEPTLEDVFIDLMSRSTDNFG